MCTRTIPSSRMLDTTSTATDTHVRNLLKHLSAHRGSDA
jgi:hypothetical protein